MRNALFLLLLLAPALALNVSVECTGPCLAYVPAAGNAVLNYSVDGRELGDVFTKAFRVNVSGDDVNNGLVEFNLTQYSCENPAAAFLNNSLETAFFDELLLAKMDVSSSNTTVKLFCSGYNTEREQASWYGVAAGAKYGSDNLTYNGTKTVMSGLDLLASLVVGLNETHEIELGRGNFTVANRTSLLNITLYDKSMQLQTYTELPDSDYVFMDYGNLTGDDRFFYVVSQGNVTILDEGLGLNATVEFNGTRGVAVTDVDNDSVNEVVVCANTTEYNVTVLDFGGSGWTYSTLDIPCWFDSFDPISYPGMNGSVVTFDSTALVLIVFNETDSWYTSHSMSNISDVASFDADGDGYDEVAVAFDGGDVWLYNITSFQQIDYLGNWGAPLLDSWDELLVENGTLGLYSTEGVLGTKASLSYFFPESIPVKIELNLTTGGAGNVTVNATSGSWSHLQTLSPGQTTLDLYPSANKTLWVNFSFLAPNSTAEPWLVVNNISVHFANLSYVNYLNYTTYSPNSAQINTSIGVGNKIVAANFSDMFTLDYFMVYLDAGNYSIPLDDPSSAISLSKPTIGTSVSVVNFNHTSVTDAVQGSQNEGNFSAVAGFDSALHLVGQDVNLTAYGTVVDYCSQGNHLLYTWNSTGVPKATMLEWDGSLTEVANATGNFSECWLNGTSVFLVNSSGGVDIYNYSLVKKDGFLNSSFVVRDVVVDSGLHMWNGTHMAYAAMKDFSSNSSFVVSGQWGSRMFLAEYVYHGSNSTEIVDAPTGDVGGDSLWEKFKGALFSLVGNVAKLFELPLGSYSSLGNEVSVAFDNGTIRTYDVNLSTPRMGRFTRFWTNVTSGSGWIALNSSETFRIDVNVTGFVHNETDTVNGFRMKCQNSTYSKQFDFDKSFSHGFSNVSTIEDGKYSCSIYPTWDVPLPLSFPSYDFTMYVDSQAPSINDITAQQYISSTVDFNLTVNVTEDSEIKQFKLYTSLPGSAIPTVSSAVLNGTGAYQIYVVTADVNYVLTDTPKVIQLNMTAEDYTGKVSGNYSIGNVTVYNSNPPDNEIVNVAPGNNIQDFDTVPLNLSVRSLSTDDANLSWMNVTLWQGSNLQTYVEATGIDKSNHTLWLNTSLSGYNQTYSVQIVSEDITGNRRESSIGVMRYGSQTITVSGAWTSSTHGTTKVYWENAFTSGSGLRNSQQITDTLTGSNETSSTTFSRKLKTPDVAVDQWYVHTNFSSANLQYIRMKYTDSVPDDLTEYVYATTNIYGINTSDIPDSIIIRVERDAGSSEKLCLKICDEYDLLDGGCDSSWVEEKCASAGLDAYSFVIDGNDDLMDNLDSDTGGEGTGVGFWVDVVAISSESTDEDTGTQTTTGLVGSAVVTITAPTSKSVDVDDCVDVTYTIKNTGSAVGSLSSITASGFDTDEMTYTMLSDIDFPYSLSVGSQLQAILSFCPLVAKTFNPSVCVKIGSSNKCVTVRITAQGGEDEGGGEEQALNLTMTVETFDDEYIVFVNSTGGAIEGATVIITYSDGTTENYTTNVFGKINFVPKLDDFTVKVSYEGETLEKSIQELTEPLGLTLWRILVDLLIIAVLIGFGVILDEKML